MKAFAIGPDTFFADNRDELPALWEAHYGETHEQIAGEPLDDVSVQEMDMTSEFIFYDEVLEDKYKGERFSTEQTGAFSWTVCAYLKDFAAVNPKGFFASTEY